MAGLDEIAAQMRACVEQAGAAIMAIYGNLAPDGIIDKQDGSPLTIADIRAHGIITAHLQKTLPDIPRISEEDDSHVTPPPKRFFLIDPLDGTKEFISRNGEFTVNVALIDSGRPVAGVILCPAHDEMFWGHDGCAYRRHQGETKQIRTRSTPSGKITALVSRSHLDDETSNFLKKFGEVEALSAGSSLKLCRVAMGAADIYPRFGRTMEWDIAAGDAILSAAGGVLVNINADAFRYGKKDYANDDGFIAYGDSRLTK